MNIDLNCAKWVHHIHKIKCVQNSHKNIMLWSGNNLMFCLSTWLEHCIGRRSLTPVMLQVVLFRRTACFNRKGDTRQFPLQTWSIRGFPCERLKRLVLIGRGRVPCSCILLPTFSCNGIALCRGRWCHRGRFGAAQLLTSEKREGGGGDRRDRREMNWVAQEPPDII